MLAKTINSIVWPFPSVGWLVVVQNRESEQPPFYLIYIFSQHSPSWQGLLERLIYASCIPIYRWAKPPCRLFSLWKLPQLNIWALSVQLAAAVIIYRANEWSIGWRPFMTWTQGSSLPWGLLWMLLHRGIMFWLIQSDPLFGETSVVGEPHDSLSFQMRLLSLIKYVLLLEFLGTRRTT